jgi:putative FmdB family regulatory protein
MPIYECHCEGCRITFEILAPVSEAKQKRPCPRCARPARRVVSAFSIGAAVADAALTRPSASLNASAGHTHTGHGQTLPGRAHRPVVPDFARLCWMDDRSAKRFAAYKLGRGAEYDDKSATIEEQRKKRGLPAPAAPTQTNSAIARMVARKKDEQAKTAKAAKARALGASP